LTLIYATNAERSSFATDSITTCAAGLAVRLDFINDAVAVVIYDITLLRFGTTRGYAQKHALFTTCAALTTNSSVARFTILSALGLSLIDETITVIVQEVTELGLLYRCAITADFSSNTTGLPIRAYTA